MAAEAGARDSGRVIRRARAEAFAQLLDGSMSAAAAPASLTAMAGVASALTALPAPALPAGLAAGRAAFMQAAAAHVAGAQLAAGTAAVATHGGAAAQAGAGLRSLASRATVKTAVAGSKPGLLAALGAHLVPLAAGTAAVAVGVAGVAVGAGQSLPGQPLYGVKRAIESVQVSTAGSSTTAARDQLAQAGDRLQEAARLRAAGDLTPIPGVVRDWVTSETAAVRVLLPLQARPAVRAQLLTFLDQQAAGLATMPAAVVAPATASLVQLAASLGVTVTSLVGRLSAVPDPSALPPVTVPAPRHTVTTPGHATSPGTRPPTRTTLAPAARSSVARPTTPASSVPGTTQLPAQVPSLAGLPSTTPSLGTTVTRLPGAVISAVPTLPLVPTALPSALHLP